MLFENEYQPHLGFISISSDVESIKPHQIKKNPIQMRRKGSHVDCSRYNPINVYRLNVDSNQ